MFLYIYRMSDLITYSYASPSSLLKGQQGDQLFLSNYSEVQKKTNPCFFWGRLKDPHTTARCLIALSNVVQSSFSLSPFEMSKLKDPIVTAGNEKIRFEGFSHCAGVYARVDVLPDGHDGEFIDTGTTNVDFNQPMISSLSRINKSEHMLLSVGSKEVSINAGNRKVVERKVPLPVKWIKGLTSVQLFLADTEHRISLNRMQALQLFQTLPSGTVKTDYYLLVRGGRAQFTPVKSAEAVCVGGIHRLKLIAPLLPMADELKVFAHPDMQSTTWQLYFGALRFSLTISRDSWRGFSGEGAALEDLLEDIPQHWVELTDNYSYANHEFNPTLFALEEDIDIQKLSSITARLAAMGLLGFDLDDNRFFYRQLPYKLERILSLNPRLKDAEKLLEEGKVEIVENTSDKLEARVQGSGVKHVVIIEGEKSRCTCTWFAKHQGERGFCKHVQAVKKMSGS